MKRKKRRYEKRMAKRYLMTGFLSGIVTLTGIIILILIVFELVSLNKQNKLKAIVAPYYDKSVFAPYKTSSDSAVMSASIKLPIVMYHYVEYVRDIDDFIKKQISLSPYQFERELQLLHINNYKTYFMSNVPDILKGKIIPSKKSIVLTFDDGYADFYRVALPLLKKYQMKATLYVIYDYIGRRGFLTEAELKEIINSGLVEIGSHTLDHVNLKAINDQSAMVQINDSKKKLEQRFKIKVNTFAYPYGSFNNANIESVKKAGYIAAVSVIPEERQSLDNLFFLSRIRPGMIKLQ